MKNLKLFTIPVVLAVGVMLFNSSCKKTYNTTVTSTDSVFYSSWQTLSMSPTDAGDTLFYQDIDAPKITSSIMEHGAVLGYFGYEYQSGDTVMLNASEAVTQYIAVGLIELTSYGDYSDYYIYRYVVVPGTVSVTSTSTNGTVTTTSYSAADLKKMSYKEVTSLLNIPSSGSGVKKSSN